MNCFTHRQIVAAAAAAVFSFGISAAFAEPVSHVAVAAPAVTQLDKAADKEKAKADASVTKLMAALLDDMLSTDGQGGIAANLDANDSKRTSDELKKKHEGVDKLINDFRAEWVKHYDDQYNASGHLGILSADKVEEMDKDGKHYATVSFDALGGTPEFTLKFVKEKDSDYRLMLPDHVDGEHLVKRIEKAVKESLDSKDSWPKGESVAYSATAHRLLYAVRTEAARDAEKTADKKK